MHLQRVTQLGALKNKHSCAGNKVRLWAELVSRTGISGIYRAA